MFSSCCQTSAAVPLLLQLFVFTSWSGDSGEEKTREPLASMIIVLSHRPDSI